MSTTEEHFEDTLNILLYQCLVGDAHYRILEKYNEALSNFPDLKLEYHTFFGITRDSYYESFFFNLCRLIDTSRGACTVEYALKYGKENPGIFKYTDKNSIVKIIEEDLKSLEKEKDLICKILGQRHNYYAHLSKKYLSSFYSDVFEEFPVSNEQMHNLLKKIFNIINHLNENFRKEKRILAIYNNKQIECEDQLSDLIQKLQDAF